MASLDRDLRKDLEKTVKQARRVAEAGARKAVEQLGVGEAEAPKHLSAEQRALRNRLRAHGRQLGRPARPEDGRAGHRASRAGMRLRALAPHAVRALPGRDRPPDRAGVGRRHHARRGAGARARESDGLARTRQRLCRADAAADLPQGRSGARRSRCRRKRGPRWRTC